MLRTTALRLWSPGAQKGPLRDGAQKGTLRDGAQKGSLRVGPKRALKGWGSKGLLKGGSPKGSVEGGAVGRWPSTNFVTLHTQSILECPTATYISYPCRLYVLCEVCIFAM